MRLVIAVALVALGCGKRDKPTTCADAARASVEVLASNAKHQREERAPALRAALTRLCVDDNWSAAAIACFAKVSSAEDVSGCRDKLAPDARTRFDEELEAAAIPDSTPAATSWTPSVAPTDTTPSASVPEERKRVDDQLRALETKLGEARSLVQQAATDADREAARAVIQELDTQRELLKRQLGPDREAELDRQMDELNRKIDEVRDQLGETSLRAD